MMITLNVCRELEKFMSYGFFHCLDSFLFVFTFLPLRVAWGCLSVLMRYPLKCLGILAPSHRNDRVLHPAEIIDLLKCFIICSCCYGMSYVDTSMLYHMIKSQSVIKLYLMYNMIEVADRLFLVRLMFNDEVKFIMKLFYTVRLLVKTLLTPCSGPRLRREGRRESTSA